MHCNKSLKFLSFILVLFLSLSVISMPVSAVDVSYSVSWEDLEEIQVPALMHTKYGGLNKFSLNLLSDGNALYISVGMMSYVGMMNGDTKVHDYGVEFVRDVKSIIDPDKTLDTIERIYTGEVFGNRGYSYVNMQQAFELLEVQHYYDGETLVLFPQLYMDDEYTTVLDEVFSSAQFSVDSITGLELLSAAAYANLKDFSLLGQITGSTYVDRYEYVLTQMLMPDATIKTDSKNLKEVQGAQEWAQLSITYGEMAESLRADIFTGFKGDRVESYDAVGAFMDYIGIGRGSWVSDVINDGENINSAIGYAMTYQNAHQVADWYSDALYYGVVRPGGDNDDDVYTYDTVYLSRAANEIYYEMNGSVPEALSYDVMEEFLSLESKTFDKTLFGSLTDYEFNVLKKAVLAILEEIGADQEIEKGLNTVICDNICERSHVGYQNIRNADYKAMKYSAIMYLLSSAYYCDMYDDYPTMVASIAGWKQSDSQFFYETKIKAKKVISRLVAIDDFDRYVSSSFGYYSVYDYENCVYDHIVIRNYYGNSSKIEIPSYIDGLPVKEIEWTAFSENKTLKKIVIPKNVESIDSGAFEDCILLEDVEIKGGVKTLSYGTFRGCSALKEIELPGVEELYDYVFRDCVSLEKVYLPSVKIISDEVFYNCHSLKVVDIPKCEEIGPLSFRYCESLEVIDAPNVKTIGWCAFHACDGLKRMYFPKVESIGLMAFCKTYDCFSHSEKSYIGTNPYLELYLSDKIPELESDMIYGTYFRSILSDPYDKVYNNSVDYGNIIVYVPCTAFEDYKNSAWADLGNEVIRPVHDYSSKQCRLCGLPEGIRIDDILDFPDEALRNYLTNEKDLDHNGVLDENEIFKLTTIDCADVYDLTGIESFTYLETLITYNGFLTVDLSTFPALRHLSLKYYSGDLDISDNPLLVQAYSKGVKYYDYIGYVGWSEHVRIKYIYTDETTGVESVLDLKYSDDFPVNVICDNEETKDVVSSIPIPSDTWVEASCGSSTNVSSEVTLTWGATDASYYDLYIYKDGEPFYNKQMRYYESLTYIFTETGTYTCYIYPYSLYAYYSICKGPEGSTTFSVYDSTEIQTGWVKKDGNSYFYDESGVMVTGWKCIDTVWYFFNDDGVLQAGWIQSGSNWYYSDPETGIMVTGWKQIKGVWYYFKGSGAMATGWVESNGKWYFLKSNGVMASDEYCNGYYLGKDGTWTYTAKAAWYQNSKGWYYQDSKGWYPKNRWLKIDDKWYFFKADGYMASNEYCNGYWLNANGTWTYQAKASWKKDSKGWYYQDTTGWYAKNGTYKIDGKNYNFNSAGYCTNP